MPGRSRSMLSAARTYLECLRVAEYGLAQSHCDDLHLKSTAHPRRPEFAIARNTDPHHGRRESPKLIEDFVGQVNTDEHG